MTAPRLWTSADAAAAVMGETDSTWTASGVSIDSRSLEPGDLFIALEGPSFDGHDYVGDALQRGAAAALVHRRPEGLALDAPLLLVDDSFRALQRLGDAGRTRSRARRLGITGSVGKTSSKEMARAALSGAGRTHASAASYNNHWGVPLTLARLPQDADFGVFEMGMNHAGEIRELTTQVRPQVALITQIAPAHIAFFADGLDGIAAAKAEIFEGLEPGGTAVVNRDAPRAEILMAKARDAGARLLTFGSHRDADYRLDAFQPTENGGEIAATLPQGETGFSLGLPGRHMALNALGVLAAALALGATLEEALPGLAAQRPLQGRGAQQAIALPQGGHITLIDEGYNANPTSVRAALSLLQAATPAAEGRRLAVLGDMLELGKDSAMLHASLAGDLARGGCDLVFTCGQEMTALQAALPASLRGPHQETSADLAQALTDAIRPGDVVLVKGSLGARMAVIVEALKALADRADEASRAAEGE
ncbi:MAG: UDP-N-acetylmuramoylalanyl-D-glutamyl-2,6-diaminopimelate--D-alanyl-D-alanine ligase [Rhodospirillales bacterium]